MRPLNGITRDDDEQKPGIDKFYDFNDYYTVCSHSNRWDLVAFCYILDTIRGNAKTFFCIKKGLDVKKENTFD